MSNKTFFGLDHLYFIAKIYLEIFFNIGSIANFEAILNQKLLMNFKENGSCNLGPNNVYRFIKCFTDYIF